MRWLVYLTSLLPLLLSTCARAQNVPERLLTGYAPLDEKLSRMVAADEHALSAEEAYAINDAVYLDAREAEEFTVSHLPGAQYIGYNDINYDILNNIPKATPLIVYCTVGYRSERIANKLRDRGFTQVYNLFGSLYAWKLAGYPVVDADGERTERIHTYNKKWGSFVPDSIGEKIW